MFECAVIRNVASPWNRWVCGWCDKAALVLGGAAILLSAIHFWPLEQNKYWQMLCPSNAAVLAGMAVAALLVMTTPSRQQVNGLLPHVSVFSYVGVNVLSIAFAADSGRATGFCIKLVLTMIGGYVLFAMAISSYRRARVVYALATAAAAISVSGCLAARFGLGLERLGFFDSAYKYGTYVGMLAPLCAAYLFSLRGNCNRVFGVILLGGAVVSSGSLGAAAAITAGMAAYAFVSRWAVRLCVIACLAPVIAIVPLLGPAMGGSFLGGDITAAEKDGANLKQRYIEWQAEVNLLEKRFAVGTGAGCINDYRSAFYHRLPKLNTLAAFDQNGWLATGAETGLVGLVCFCWVVCHYGKSAFRQAKRAVTSVCWPGGGFAKANFAGLAAACTANVFSSVHYNGVLIVFVLLLALASRVDLIREGC